MLIFLNSHQYMYPKILKTHLPRLWSSFATVLPFIIEKSYDQLDVEESEKTS